MTPPEKRPDRHYNFGRMNMVFALSSLGLLAVTLWMVVADYAQPWKRFQSEFRSLERQKLAREAKAESDKLSANELAQLNKEVASAEAALDQHHDEIAKLEKEVDQRKGDRYVAESAWRGAKAKLDAARFEYDAAVQAKANQDEKAKARDQRSRDLLAAKGKLDQADDALAAAQQKLAERKAALTDAEKKLADLRKGVSGLETRIAALDKNAAYFLLNAPLTDFVQPSIKVEQAVLPGLTHNFNFTDVNRVDRCMTCHVAANRPGFDGPEWKEPFRTHPNLDVFVGDASPHSYTQYGCTVCHGGLDRATDFTRAGHSPKNEEQAKEWTKKYGWHEPKYLEYPILPAGMSQAGCATCHAAGVWTGKAEVQDTGRELIAHMGCYGCHQISYPAYTGLRKAGPSLQRIAGKTNPGWAYKWIEAPRKFHPTTWMPHFFYQENTTTPVNLKRQQTEIAAIVNYLWDKSEKPVYPPAPAGNAANGKVLFESVGCAGCHIIDANAKRDQYFPTINRLHGPNLIWTGSKVDKGWLYAWVKNPKQYFPDSNMPNLRLTDQEAADVTEFIWSSHNQQYENTTVPALDAATRDDLALSYLQNLYTIERSKATLAGMNPHQRDVFLGEQTITKYGCYGCHDIKGFENLKPIGTELTQEGSKPLHQFDFAHVTTVPDTRHDWVKTKLLDPRIWDKDKEQVKDYNELLKMPNFGMSDREAEAVAANVLGFTKETVAAAKKAGMDPRTAALAEGRKLITRYNCQGCHLIEGQGHAIKTVIQDPTMLPPNLAAEGARVQSDWLFSYVHDPSQVRMRPWLTVRMPTFGFADDQLNTVVGYFASREQRRPFSSEPPAADARSLAVGQVAFNMFQCAKCHPAGAEAAAATGGAKGDLAPSLLLAHDRLRYDWVPGWIKNPQFWIPGTRMPTNFPEMEPGKFMSPVAQAIDSPTYAAEKQRMMQFFSSEAELKEYLSDADKVTTALRDHIWSLSGGGRRQPALASPAGGASVTAAGAGGR
jgi:cbb3-type cytochrome oxidase cytochrome c subunit/predicted  nucleic acid-binding Zn-ribbon protein